MSELVYRALLRSPVRSSTDLAGLLGEDEAAVEAAVCRLEGLSLVRRSWEQPDLLVPVAPELAVGALLAQMEEQVLSRQQELERSRAAVARLLSEYQRAASVGMRGGLERLEGVDAARGRVRELGRQAGFEMIAFDTSAHSVGALETLRQVDREALERGVALRRMYLESVRNHPLTLAHARWLTEAGAEVRTAPTLPLMMIIVDRAVAVLPLEPEQTRAGAVTVTEKAVVMALHALFEQYWTAGTPFGQRPEPGQSGLAPSDRELLRLLALGMTDEKASRQLGVSLRTVRRMMSDMTDRLEARSRFQAGVLAGRRGWL